MPPLLELVVVIIVIGVLLWFVESYVPMSAPLKRLLQGVVVLLVVLWLLQSFGLFSSGVRLR